MRKLKVVAVVNTKGGVGKTMLTRSLALAATRPDNKQGNKRKSPLVAMIDLDPQKGLEGWWDLRGGGTSELGKNEVSVRNPDLMRGGSLEAAIEHLERRHYDWLFVDTPPAFIPEVEEVAARADFIVIPTRPDIENVKASRDAIVIARRAIKDRYLVVINSAPVRGSQESATRAALMSAQLPVAEQTLWQHASHSRAADQGKTAAEIDAEAAREIDTLWNEIRRRVTATRPVRG